MENLNDNIVLSSRIRLARNIDKIPFPNKITIEEGRNIVKEVENAFYCEKYKDKYKSINLWDLDIEDSNALLEKHVISFNLINNKEKSSVILDGIENNTIMINEEDHIRIQCITPGLNLEESLKKANEIDDVIENSIKYAFHKKLGYLTACPTNIGTGLRASVMIHLPALTINNEITGLFNAISQVGMTVRGMYGEGSKSLGNIYQISNQVTLGLDEMEIINNLKAIITQVINEEINSRERLLKNYEYEIKDKIYRSLGMLKSAILLGNSECLNYLSNVRLGIEMSIIEDIDEDLINELFLKTQPANLKIKYKKDLSEKEIKYYRAKLVKDILTK